MVEGVCLDWCEFFLVVLVGMDFVDLVVVVVGVVGVGWC